MNDESSNLSPAGVARREQILAIAQQAARTRRHRRQAARAAMSLAVVALVVTAALRALLPSRPTTIVEHAPTPTTQPTTPTPETAPVSPRIVIARKPRILTIDRIGTDAALASRLKTPESSITIEKLTDDQLFSRLTEAGRPAGILQTKGRSKLIFHNDAVALASRQK